MPKSFTNCLGFLKVAVRKIKQFQEALPGYQIKVMSITPPHMIIYVGPTPSEKIIRLIKDGDHYDGCSSFNGFMSKSYFCDECNRGFDHHNHHLCLGKWCPSCKRDNCSDQTTLRSGQASQSNRIMSIVSTINLW